MCHGMDTNTKWHLHVYTPLFINLEGWQGCLSMNRQAESKIRQYQLIPRNQLLLQGFKDFCFHNIFIGACLTQKINPGKSFVENEQLIHYQNLVLKKKKLCMSRSLTCHICKHLFIMVIYWLIKDRQKKREGTYLMIFDNNSKIIFVKST